MIEWFDKRPGDSISQSQEDPTMALIGDIGTGDYVRLPPELGSKQVHVLSTHRAECPKCKGGEVKHMTLEDSLGVAECDLGCGFVWYRG